MSSQEEHEPGTPEPSRLPRLRERMEALQQRLEHAERECEERRRRHRARLLAEWRETRDMLANVEHLAERAGAAECGDHGFPALLADLKEHLDSLIRELGYDPTEETERQERRRRFAEGSQAKRNALLTKLGNATSQGELRMVANELEQALMLLTLEDVGRVLERLLESLERECLETPPAVAGVREYLASFDDAESAEDRHFETVEATRERNARLGRLDREIRQLVQEAMDLETAAIDMDPHLAEARVHLLCCRGKLLQREHAHLLDPGRERLLHRDLFGRLRATHERRGLGFVPSLDRSWSPSDLRVEIRNTEGRIRRLESASRVPRDDQGPAAPAAADDGELRQARRALSILEDFALAKVAEAVSSLEKPISDEDAQALREDVGDLLEGLSPPRRRELATLLADVQELFEEGPAFRPLRRQWNRNDEPAEPEEADRAGRAPAAIEAAEDPLLARARSVARGRTIWVIGGSRRADKERTLCERLEADVHWVEDGDPRARDFLQRLRQGTVDVVICFLRFSSHETTRLCNLAAREGLAAKVLPRGYGTGAILRAVTELLEPGAPG